MAFGYKNKLPFLFNFEMSPKLYHMTITCCRGTAAEAIEEVSCLVNSTGVLVDYDIYYV